MRVTVPAHLILRDLIILIIFREEYKLLSLFLCSFLQIRVISFMLCPNPQSMFLRSSERPNFTPKQNYRKISYDVGNEFLNIVYVWAIPVTGRGGP
jgi:hypothetical protein